jgi:hypothetical protein
MGICSNCTLINVPAVSDGMLEGSLPIGETARQLAEAVRRTVDEGCRLILFGIAIRKAAHPDWSQLRETLRCVAQAGVLAIVPAANSAEAFSSPQISWPETLTVASHDWRGMVSSFSRAHGRTRPVVFAPGENIPGAADDNDFVVWSGSSGAAAIAAGSIALCCSLWPYRSTFDVAGTLFSSCNRVLDGRRCLKISSSHVLETELSYGN